MLHFKQDNLNIYTFEHIWYRLSNAFEVAEVYKIAVQEVFNRALVWYLFF